MKKENKKDKKEEENFDFLKDWKDLNPDPPVVKPDKPPVPKEK
jgi:hypothetical protein